jgi:predicted enzyme related to lactoylglutathione lyase
MPTRDVKWPVGTPCWVDAAVPDLDAATAFYGAVLGWTFHDTGEDYGHFQMCMAGEQTAAGIGKIQMEGQPAAWTVYLASDNADETVKVIKENGGTVFVEPMDIPQIGRMAIAADPTGAAFGVWQADPVPGISIYNEPGGLVWEDARLTDPDAGKRFYTAIFGYEYTPIEGAPDDYGTFGVGGGDPLGGMGGMMGAPEGTPSHWQPYFGVSDVDTAVAAAESGGGTVIAPAMDTPYGRMASLLDPFGAVFAVHCEIPA